MSWKPLPDRSYHFRLQRSLERQRFMRKQKTYSVWFSHRPKNISAKSVNIVSWWRETSAWAFQCACQSFRVHVTDKCCIFGRNLKNKILFHLSKEINAWIFFFCRDSIWRAELFGMKLVSNTFSSLNYPLATQYSIFAAVKADWHNWSSTTAVTFN